MEKKMKKFIALGLTLLSFSIVFADEWADAARDITKENQVYYVEVDDGEILEEVDNCPLAKTKAKQYFKKGAKKVKISARYGAWARSGCRNDVYRNASSID